MSEKDDRTPDFESEGVAEVNITDVPSELAILPLRDTILFPHAILPLAVARESSVALVHDAVRERKVIGVITQRDPAVDDPVESDLYRVGTLTHIHKMFKFPDGSLRLVVQGVQRFRLKGVSQYRPFIKATIELLSETVPAEQEIEVRPWPRARRACSSAWWSSAPRSRTSCRRWRPTSRSRPAWPTSSRPACPA